MAIFNSYVKLRDGRGLGPIFHDETIPIRPGLPITFTTIARATHIAVLTEISP
jgi:hypothetical protein